MNIAPQALATAVTACRRSTTSARPQHQSDGPRPGPLRRAVPLRDAPQVEEAEHHDRAEGDEEGERRSSRESIVGRARRGSGTVRCVRAVVFDRAGRRDGAPRRRGAGAGLRAARAAHPRARRGREPRRPDAAPGPLPAAARAPRRSSASSAPARWRRSAREVRGWAAGERAMALLAGGGYAEEVGRRRRQRAARARRTSPTRQAAALPEVLLTVFLNVFQLGALPEGGVGARARRRQRHRHRGDPLVKAAGGRIVVTAGSDEKCRSCQELGADLAVNYRDERLRRRACAS